MKLEQLQRLLKRLTPELIGILFINFIGSLGFSIVIPFLVILVYRYGGNATIYGLVGAAYPAFQLLGGPLLGKWSDSWGRRPILLLSQLGTLASWGIFAAALLVPNVWSAAVQWPVFGAFTLTLPLILIAVARSLDGLTGGNISVAQAYLADITTTQTRAKYYGIFSMAQGIGFMLGPVLAGLLVATAWGELTPVLAAFAISLVAAVYIAGWLPESNRQPGPQSKSTAGTSQKSIWQVLKLLPTVRWLLAINVVMFVGFNFFYVAFPIHATQGLGWSGARMGLFFAGLSLVMVVVQGPVLQYLSRLLKERHLILLGSSILAVSLALMSSSNDWWLYLAAVLYALGNGLMWPSFMAILSHQSEQFQGTVQGLGASAGSLAGIIGLVGGGWLYQSIEAQLFWLAALLLFVSGLAVPLIAQPADDVATSSTF